MHLQAEQVSFHYDDDGEPVLKDVSFELRGGECVALAGPSGSGKSTLAQLLNGLLSPTRGRLLAEGRPYPKDAAGLRDLRRRVGLVFQFPEAQIFEATVHDEVAFAARRQGVSEAEVPGRVEAALAAVGLDPEAFRPRNPLKLSGGEDRLITLASLLVVDPDWLILDEPTLGLDGAHTARVREMIRARQARGRGVVLITHDLELTLELCPRILALRRGELAWDGSPRELLVRPDLESAFGLAAPLTVVLWQRLAGAFPEAPPDDPTRLEAWVEAQDRDRRKKIPGVLQQFAAGGRLIR